MTPDFQQLSTRHIDPYYSFTNRFMSYSDVNFTSLISWSPKVLFRFDSTHLFLCFEDYTSDTLILTGISERPDAFIRELLSLRARIPNSIITTLPSVVVEGLEDMSLQENLGLAPDQADYLYRPRSQVTLQGHKFSWHRRKLSIFNREVSDCYITVDRHMRPGDAETFQKVWTVWKEASNPKEVEAINRYIQYFDNLVNQFILKIFIEGGLQGFALCELVNGVSRDLLIHFFKTNKAYEGLSNYFFVEIAKVAGDMKAEFVNFEQDLNEPGLRYYKQHLRPDKMLEKYTAVL